MPKKTTPTSTLSNPVLFTEETLRRAADLATNSYSFRPVWAGGSGEESTGESVARHLEATAALLDTDGWVRIYSTSVLGDNAVPEFDETATTEDMVRALLDLVRDEPASGSPRPLSMALRHVAEGEHGDPDTCEIAGGILTLIIRAHTGSDTATATAWSERLHRTHADITALLTAGAAFARAYGPGAAALDVAAA
ncbi:DUF6197 family protein [Streptomyces sp. IBSBF 3010]|uniref:DUF6197 family protein n=1 Tax=Streptomyces sp. IBSBF 3010 TaxID=2903526 RepID=UPI002FDBD75C